jgi:hypothetical protein
MNRLPKSKNNTMMYVIIAVVVCCCCCIISSLTGGLASFGIGGSPSPSVSSEDASKPTQNAAASNQVGFNPQNQVIKSVKNTSFCLDVPFGTNKAKYPLVSWTCNNGENQQWTYKDSMLINKKSGMCLDIKNNEKQAGVHVGQFKCNASAQNQKWVYNSDKTLTSPSAPGMCLDLKGGNVGNGTETILWNCNNVDNQKWTL